MYIGILCMYFFFFQAEDGIRDAQESRGLGDVYKRNVWMRLRRAGLIASAQRSMSFGDARERPQITAFLERLAISCTAAKSPSEAIGKPASMMSTPMVSSSSATASFSSCVMVAPGHCSPSRNVVSKMTTRSLSDWVLLVMALILLVECAAFGRSMGCSLRRSPAVSYTHLRAHETPEHLV